MDVSTAGQCDLYSFSYHWVPQAALASLVKDLKRISRVGEYNGVGK